MEGYLSIGEAAERWGVSEGRICQYCLRGRIPGAKRLGGAWVIPESADRPSGSQPAKPGKTPELFSHLMPLMNTPFRPGKCRSVIAAMPEGPQRDIATAEYHYFSGHPEEAARESRTRIFRSGYCSASISRAMQAEFMVLVMPEERQR